MNNSVVAFLIAGLLAVAYPVQAQQPLSLPDALEQGKVNAEISGSGLSSVGLTIRRVGKEGISVLIPVGTFFVNTGAAQNMVSTTAEVIDLTSEDTTTVPIAAACANFHRAEPDYSSSFTIRGTSGNRELDRLMQVIAGRHPSEVVSQVAVWVVTDNPSREELDSTYQSSFSSLGGGSPAASDADIEEAQALLEEAGIETAKKQLFQ